LHSHDFSLTLAADFSALSEQPQPLRMAQEDMAQIKIIIKVNFIDFLQKKKPNGQ